MNVRAVRQAMQGVGVLVACLLVTDVTQAQDSKPVSVGVMGGLSLPMGDIGDVYDSGFNVTGSVYYKPSSMRFGLRGDVGYDRFALSSSTNVASANLGVLSFSGNVLFPLSTNGGAGSIRPYLLGGGGLYRSSFSVDAGILDGSVSSTDIGIALGGGVEFKLAGFSTFAEAKFTNVFRDGSSLRYIPLTFGVRF